MKILLVDDEEQILRGVSRMIRAEMDEWEVDTALSGEDALQTLQNENFDVVVSDMRMPGMDGAELLGQISLNYPQIFRVVLSGQANRETVLHAVRPMHQYLAKPCDSEKLIAIIRRAEIFQETILSSEILIAIGKKDCLPSIPDNLVELNDALDSEDSTAKMIAEIVSRDPALCAKILQLANSSIFGLRHPVVEISRAVNVIGNDVVRTIAISQAIFAEAKESSILSPTKLFEHCFRTAGIAKQICAAQQLDSDTQFLTFTSALLHDIGKILLVNAFPERYREMLDRQLENETVWKMEFEEFGASHPGIGAYLLDLWGLPEEVIMAVAAHHSIDICAKSGIHSQIVFAANWIANQCEEAWLEIPEDSSTDREVVEAFVDQVRQWQAIAQEAEECVET